MEKVKFKRGLSPAQWKNGQKTQNVDQQKNNRSDRVEKRNKKAATVTFPA